MTKTLLLFSSFDVLCALFLKKIVRLIKEIFQELSHKFFLPIRSLLVIVLFSFGTTNGFCQSAVSEIHTDWNGYWKSNKATGVGNRPDTENNLLAFKWGNTTYSTGINDATLTSNGVVYNAQKFRALKIQNLNYSSSTYFIQGSLIDGSPSARVLKPGLLNSTSNSAELSSRLTDGEKGLALGTGIANIAKNSVYFEIGTNSLNHSGLNDGVPDIIVTQVAQPGGADVFQFIDASGKIVGNSITVAFGPVPVVGSYSLDLFNASNGLPAAGFSAGEIRDIRILGYDISAFGITASNAAQVYRFVVNFSGESDCAFIAFNSNSLKLSELSLVNKGTVLGCGVVGDKINYSFEITNTGEVTITDINLTDTMSGLIITGPINFSLAAGESKTLNGTYIITAADVVAGKVINSAKVTGIDPSFNQVVDISGKTIADDIATVTILSGPSEIGGENFWRGSVYTYTDTPSATTYVGSVAEKANFDRNLGEGVITGDASVEADNFCGTAPSDNFFVRYLMNVTLAESGIYNIRVGADDGYRLYIDNVLVTGNWTEHSYSSSFVKQNLNAGNHQFKLEYYERAGGSRISFSYGLIKGDPTLPYGDKVWNVYGFTTNDFNTVISNSPSYSGYYVDPNLNINTSLNSWASAKSPSAAANWQGAPIPNDNFTISLRRKGFPCGNYQIQLANRDDAVQLYIDDILKEEISGNSDNAVFFGNGATYPLTKDSKVELRLREDAGLAYVTVNFKDIVFLYDGSATPPAGSSIQVNQNVTVSTGDLEVCSCYISAGQTLTVASGRTLTVKEEIDIKANGKLIIENQGSLLQSDAGTYKEEIAGSFIYKRTSAAMKNLDYTYWSSPVVGQTIKKLSPNTLTGNYFKWTGNAWDGNVNVMGRGIGYIIRTPANWTGSKHAVEFKGVPYNGTFGGEAVVADKNNLVGNPYPSAISADKFIEANKNIIDGALYFWTHNSARKLNGSGTAYVYTSDDYAIYSVVGGVATAKSAKTDSDYNPDPSSDNGVKPTGYIAAGQSFFARGKGTGTVTFNNDMRVVAKNTQFFKISQSNTNADKSRIWLNLSNDSGAFKQILVGYLSGATNDFESQYDAKSLNGNAFVNFYSVLSDEKMSIQGRALPFSVADEIPLGYSSTIATNFTIEIDEADGELVNQAVFLQDKLTGVTYNLRKSPYKFTTDKGTFNDRFILKYKNSTLGVDDFDPISKGLIVSVQNKIITVNAQSENIDKVVVYDISGKMIYSNDSIYSSIFVIDNLKSSNQMLLLKITLENGNTQVEKIMI